MHPREKLPQIQWLPEGTEPLSRFQLWYYQNQDTLSAKRKHKYRTDPDYREKVLLRSRAYHETSVAPKKYFKIALNGKLYKAYKRNYVFCFIGTWVNSIPKWEKKGLIPFCIFPAPRRYYTGAQIGLLYEFLCLYAAWKETHNEKYAALLKQQTAKMYHCWYDGSLEDSADK